MARIPDRRFTVSVAAEVAEKLDLYVSSIGNTSRSAVVEQALRVWETLAEYGDKEQVQVQVLEKAMALYKREQERELYRSYYAELSKEAKAEERSWLQLSQESADKNWPVEEAVVATSGEEV